MNDQAAGMAFRIGFLLIDGFALMSYSAAVEPLRAANLLAGRILYDVRHIPVSGERSRSSSGAEIPATARIGEPVDFDLVLVVAGGDPSAFASQKAFAWLRMLASRGVIIGGVSGGPFVLARAGVMQGRRMTVHWEHAEALLAMRPDTILERSLYVVDRDRMTCAGGAAALDMMHALIAGHHGQAFATRVSDWFVHTDVRPSGGPQRAGIAERYRTANGFLLAAIQAMQDHIADPLPVGALASRAGVGERQLTRLFTKEMKRSPMAFYRDLRLDTARGLVVQSGLSMTDIALACGFANSAHFSQAYAKRFGQAPSRDRG
ncbi:MAG: GlxA family transcriptional regulator [Rhodobiaceae bacterium]|nr:GlxA family transcriptional regulator [Rhodobiaceae bacterium]